MPDEFARPFLCDGNPFAASVFIVGFNPATSLRKNFWGYWDDKFGMNRNAFMHEYREAKPVRGVRARLERIVEQLRPQVCIETNIYSTPTNQAKCLSKIHRNIAPFNYLFDHIKPNILFLHSNKPIEFFEAELGIKLQNGILHTVTWRNQQCKIYARRGPLYRASYEEADRIGLQLREWS